MGTEKGSTLNLETVCPTFAFNKILINPETGGKVKFSKHWLPLREARNGGYHAYCYTHGIRVFFNGEILNAMIRFSSEVVRVRPNKSYDKSKRRSRRRETA